jgi:hypothetical protein
MSVDKAQLRKRINKVSFKHKALIRKLSMGFTIAYKKLNLKQHPEFLKADKKYMNYIKSYHQHGYKRTNEVKIPKNPN